MHLIFDFDKTITHQDTIDELIQSAIRTKPAQHRAQASTAWQALIKSYLAGLDAYKTTYRPPEAQRTTIASEQDFLAGLEPIEEASVRRVSQANLLTDLDEASRYKLGLEASHVQLRPGFESLLNKAQQRGAHVAIVSVNWSRAWIRGLLHPLVVDVVANEMTRQGGERIMTTSSHKLRAVLDLASTWREAVYVGDSATDLECLLWARVGVVMADGDSDLLRTLARVGVRVDHVSRLSEGGLGHGKRVLWARDFCEMLDSGILKCFQGFA